MNETVHCQKVIIIGAGGHARVIADIVASSGDTVIGFLDDREATDFSDLQIIGKIKDAYRFNDGDVRFAIGIGNCEVRKRIAIEMKDLVFYTAIHPSAVIAKNVVIGYGTVIMANAVINTGSTIGNHCIINTAATVDHDNFLGDFVHLSPGVHLSGTVYIGECTWLGVGAVVSNNVNICGECVIGAGAVVIRSIMKKGIYVGVPVAMLNKGKKIKSDV